MTAVGRWLNADPIGLAGGLNLYGYVNNKPTKTIDPLGFSGDAAGALIGGFSGGTVNSYSGAAAAYYVQNNAPTNADLAIQQRNVLIIGGVAIAPVGIYVAPEAVAVAPEVIEAVNAAGIQASGNPVTGRILTYIAILTGGSSEAPKIGEFATEMSHAFAEEAEIIGEEGVKIEADLAEIASHVYGSVWEKIKGLRDETKPGTQGKSCDG